MSEDDLEFSATYVDDSAEMHFEWRLTKDGKSIKAEVGDQFVAMPNAGDSPEELVTQVGMLAMMAAARLLGLSHDQAKTVTLLALNMDDDVMLGCGCVAPCEGHEREEG